MIQAERFLKAPEQLALRMEGGQPSARASPLKLGCSWLAKWGESMALRVRNHRCCLRLAMPLTAEGTQPSRCRRPSILLYLYLYLSSSKPRTGAKLAPLAKGILAVIFNRRRYSSLSGCRGPWSCLHCPQDRISWRPLATARCPVRREASWIIRLLFGSLLGGRHLLSLFVGGTAWILVIPDIPIEAELRVTSSVI